MKKRIYELIIDYMKMQPEEVASYLEQIYESCLRSFIGDKNSLVREVSL